MMSDVCIFNKYLHFVEPFPELLEQWGFKHSAIYIVMTLEKH